MRIFGPCRSPSTATHLPTCSATSRTICTRLRVRRRLAVREVHAHDVRAGAQHLGEHLGIVGGGAERGQDLGATEHRR